MKSDFFLKLYLIASGMVFFLVGIFHLFRLIYQWPVTVGSFTVPFLLSYAGLPSAMGGVVLVLWLLSRKRRNM